MVLAEMLERACRLASGLEGIMKERASQCANVDSAAYTTWLLASELLYVLDEGRASMVFLKTGTERQSLRRIQSNSSSGA